MAHKYVLMQYYIRYLKEVRKLSDSSVGQYTQAINKISKMLVQRGKICESIYEIKDLHELEIVREYIFEDSEFVALDTRGNRMYSAGLNNYFRFANGEGFYEKQAEMSVMDIRLPVGEKIIVTSEEWKRSTIIKAQTIKAADYQCELNPEHETFIARSSGKQYMEGHHAIPMHWQDKFENSIDIYANVICLCPICHRLLHYGLRDDKQLLLNQIYETRINRLVESGIKISKSDFIELAV